MKVNGVRLYHSSLDLRLTGMMSGQGLFIRYGRWLQYLLPAQRVGT